MSFGKKIQNKFKNITDTNLLLMITIVVFFAMYRRQRQMCIRDRQPAPDDHHCGFLCNVPWCNSLSGKRIFKASDIF